jgi:hypothetical protein
LATKSVWQRGGNSSAQFFVSGFCGFVQRPKIYPVNQADLPSASRLSPTLGVMGATMLKKLLLIAALAVPFAAWALIKPIRVLAPELAGVTCVERVCVDDISRLPEAQALAKEAIEFVQLNVGQLQRPPRMIFCSGKACSNSFGFTSNGAYNVATVGLVVSHRGWYPYYVRHELIHHLQNEHLGSLRAWLLKPDWFREGMAYSLSQDPRHPLPEPLEGYRSQYEAWVKQVGTQQIWKEAEHIQQ